MMQNKFVSIQSVLMREGGPGMSQDINKLRLPVLLLGIFLNAYFQKAAMIVIN